MTLKERDCCWINKFIFIYWPDTPAIWDIICGREWEGRYTPFSHSKLKSCKMSWSRNLLGELHTWMILQLSQRCSRKEVIPKQNPINCRLETMFYVLKSRKSHCCLKLRTQWFCPSIFQKKFNYSWLIINLRLKSAVKCDKKRGRRTDLSSKRYKQFVFDSTLTWENCENGGSKLLWRFGGLYVAFVNLAWIKPRKASPRDWEERLSEYAFAKIYRAEWSGSHNKFSRQVVTGREKNSRERARGDKEAVSTAQGTFSIFLHWVSASR